MISRNDDNGDSIVLPTTITVTVIKLALNMVIIHTVMSTPIISVASKSMCLTTRYILTFLDRKMMVFFFLTYKLLLLFSSDQENKKLAGNLVIIKFYKL